MRRPPKGGYRDREVCIDKHRGHPAYFQPANCTLAQTHLASLRGTVLLIGDSLTQFQFDSLVSWFRRAGLPLKCVRASPLPRLSSTPSSAAASAVRDLMFVDRYGSTPMDCMRGGARSGGEFRLMVRRLNLLPTSESEIEHLLSPLLVSVGALSKPTHAVVNVGLWYDHLSHHKGLRAADGGDSEASGGGVGARRRLAMRMLDEGVRALVRVACRHTEWPRMLWREHTRQHFARGGWYRRNVSRLPCAPLRPRAATAMYDAIARRPMESFMSGELHGRHEACARDRLDALPSPSPSRSRSPLPSPSPRLVRAIASACCQPSGRSRHATPTTRARVRY